MDQPIKVIYTSRSRHLKQDQLYTALIIAYKKSIKRGDVILFPPNDNGGVVAYDKKGPWDHKQMKQWGALQIARYVTLEVVKWDGINYG